MKGHNVHTGTIRDINVFDNISKRIVKNLYRISNYEKRYRYNPLVSMRYANTWGYTYGALKEMKTESNHSKNKYEIFRLEFLERRVSSKLSYSSIRLKKRYDNNYTCIYNSLFRRKHIRTLKNIEYVKYSSNPKTMKELCIMINNNEEEDNEDE